MSDLFGDRASGFRAGHGSPNIFDDLAVAFNDQFRGVTRVNTRKPGSSGTQVLASGVLG